MIAELVIVVLVNVEMLVMEVSAIVEIVVGWLQSTIGRGRRSQRRKTRQKPYAGSRSARWQCARANKGGNVRLDVGKHWPRHLDDRRDRWLCGQRGQSRSRCQWGQNRSRRQWRRIASGGKNWTHQRRHMEWRLQNCSKQKRLAWHILVVVHGIVLWFR